MSTQLNLIPNIFSLTGEKKSKVERKAFIIFFKYVTLCKIPSGISKSTQGALLW